MKLRERLVGTLFVITLILVAPAVYGLFALNDLRQLAYNLSTRDAVGALTLGRLQTAFSEVENAQRIYLALPRIEGAERDRERARARVAQRERAVEAELRRLAEGGYRRATDPATAAWQRLRAAIREEQRLIESGAVDEAARYRTEVVDPAFDAVDRTLDPIGRAINEVGRSQVRRAQEIAAGAATTTLLALAVALGIALLIGGWLARSVLRPIQHLRGAMSEVAAGDLDPERPLDTARADEIGDLNRSFTRMTEQLAELDRLKAEFVSVASHELKTPLSVIKGYVSLLQDGIYGEVAPEQHKVLESVSSQTDQLARLIQQLLDISRFEAGGGRLYPQPVDLRAFFGDLATSFEALAVQNHIDFRVEIDESLPDSLSGDADRLREVFGNLLSNAFKFTPREGQIRLHARKGDRAEESGIVVKVRDTGVGIPPDKLPRIFEKFFQVENSAQPRSAGSGLGLAISREIVEAHGGTITAESQPGEGTTFCVFLPLVPPPQEGA